MKEAANNGNIITGESVSNILENNILKENVYNEKNLPGVDLIYTSYIFNYKK